MNFSISNQALDLTALSIPERQINRGAVTATVSPMFCHFFSSAKLFMGVTSQTEGEDSCFRVGEI